MTQVTKVINRNHVTGFTKQHLERLLQQNSFHAIRQTTRPALLLEAQQKDDAAVIILDGLNKNKINKRPTPESLFFKLPNSASARHPPCQAISVSLGEKSVKI